MHPVQADEIQQEAQQALQAAKLKGAELEEAEQLVANAEKHARDLETAGRGQEAMIAAAAANQCVCFSLLQLSSSIALDRVRFPAWATSACGAVLCLEAPDLQHTQDMSGVRVVHLAGMKHHAFALFDLVEELVTARVLSSPLSCGKATAVHLVCCRTGGRSDSSWCVRKSRLPGRQLPARRLWLRRQPAQRPAHSLGQTGCRKQGKVCNRLLGWHQLSGRSSATALHGCPSTVCRMLPSPLLAVFGRHGALGCGAAVEDVCCLLHAVPKQHQHLLF